jgi:2-oxoglutarate ferredoxin oxidoreductase subunit alpha
MEICNATYSDPRQRQLFKNIIYVGALSTLLDLDPAEVEKLIGEQYKGKEKLLEPNIKALHMGRDFARDHLPAIGLKVRRSNGVGKRVFLEGNSAAGPGLRLRRGHGRRLVPDHAVVLDGRGLLEALPQVPHRSRQRQGALRDRAGRGRALVHRHGDRRRVEWRPRLHLHLGPGISLMGEFIGLAYFAEIPAVIFDVQRAGPSTGMPTRTQQSDVLSCAYASHGDTKHVLLFPEDPKEGFEMAALSFDLADRLQTPIFVLYDLDIGMNERLCEPLAWDDNRRYDRGKVLSYQDLEAGKRFGRYLDLDADGITYRTYPGTHPQRGAFFTRGTSRDRYARYTEEGSAYVDNMQRLLKKFETAKELVPAPGAAQVRQGRALRGDLLRLDGAGHGRGARDPRVAIDARGCAARARVPVLRRCDGLRRRARARIRGRAEPRRAAPHPAGGRGDAPAREAHARSCTTTARPITARFIHKEISQRLAAFNVTPMKKTVGG